MEVVVGFDFGTCFSSVYFIHGNECVGLCPQDENTKRNLVPTVYYKKGDKELFGTKAVRQGKSSQKNLVKYIKRKYKDDFVMVGDDMQTPEMIVEKIVAYMINGAKDSLREQYHIDFEKFSVILTIPVSYGEKWKLMLMNALKKLDVEIKAVIPEPVAAAVYFAENNFQANKNILVYDLGGGTTDVTLLRTSGNKNEPYEVIAQNGEDIGGTDWDERVLNVIEQQIYDLLVAKGLSDEECEKFLENNRPGLLETAVEIKESLTDNESYSTDFEDRGEYYPLELTRSHFDDFTKNLLDRTINLVKRTIMEHDKPDEVILVGGGSHMKQVKARMEKEFPDCPVNIKEPEVAVAKGATKYAELYNKNSVILKAPHSYGIVCTDNGKRVIHNLIFKNQKIPADGKYELHSDGVATQFDIYEGEISDTSRIEVPLAEGRYAVSASVWLDNKSSGDKKYFSALEMEKSGLLKLKILDSVEKTIAEAEMQE